MNLSGLAEQLLPLSRDLFPMLQFHYKIFNYLENSAGQQINQDLFHLFSHHTVSSSIIIFQALIYSMTEFSFFFSSNFLRISIFDLFIKSSLLVSLFCPAFPASLISPCHFQPQAV